MGIREIAMEFLGRGGKRLRPRLCKAVFERCGGEGDIGPVLEAVECFHKASLIHDDIQDGDEERYGKPATWKEHGVAVAIAAGDWLVARGYKLLAGSGFAGAAGMLAAAAESHLRLSEGQAEDLLGGADYEGVCERKTGEAFALAAQLGALAAGADDGPFREYGLAYGVLFQIMDDLADGAEAAGLEQLKEKYEDKTTFHRDQCALGVW